MTSLYNFLRGQIGQAISVLLFLGAPCLLPVHPCSGLALQGADGCHPGALLHPSPRKSLRFVPISGSHFLFHVFFLFSSLPLFLWGTLCKKLSEERHTGDRGHECLKLLPFLPPTTSIAWWDINFQVENNFPKNLKTLPHYFWFLSLLWRSSVTPSILIICLDLFISGAFGIFFSPLKSYGKVSKNG